MKIALFGGSFDPPHVGHHSIATNLIAQKYVDQVWFVPVKRHPFGKVVGHDHQRLDLVKLMISRGHHRKALKIQTYELDKDKPSYSLETLQFFKNKYPQHTFSWVIGSDNLPSFDKWYQYEALLNSFAVFVYPRHGSPFSPLYPSMVALEDMPYVTVSSTLVRERINQGLPITGLVDPAVETYIKDHHLYVAGTD